MRRARPRAEVEIRYSHNNHAGTVHPVHAASRWCRPPALSQAAVKPVRPACLPMWAFPLRIKVQHTATRIAWELGLTSGHTRRTNIGSSNFWPRVKSPEHHVLVKALNNYCIAQHGGDGSLPNSVEDLPPTLWSLEENIPSP